MPNLQGKIALITGASSGIGAMTAVEFAKFDCKLALSGRNIERLNKTKNSCIEVGKLKDSDVLAVKADMTVSSDLETLVEETIKHFGKLDILVNNAGITIFGCGAGSDPIDQFDKIMNTNVRGIIELTQLCLPHIKTSKGSIVNVSSIASNCPFPVTAYYCMSKAALDSYTQCLALEVGKDGVRVNSVNPGAIQTEIFHTKSTNMTPELYEQMEMAMKFVCPLGRIGKSVEVAKTIAFLSSDDSSFTTGQILNICGGFSITTAGAQGHNSN